MKKIYLGLVVFGIFVLIGSVLFYLHSQPSVTALDLSTKNLKQEDLVNLVKPAVVRIVHHVSGKLTFHSFDIDLKNNFAIFDDHGKPLTLDIDDYLLGTGFIINSDGYIVSNAHVVSDDTELVTRAQGVAGFFIYDKFYNMSDADAAKYGITKENVTQKAKDLLQQLTKYIIAHSDSTLKNELTVVKPGSSQENISALVKAGIPAKLISANSNFAFDNKDLGQIKIDVDGKLPYLKLGDSSALKAGSKLYVFGFPSTADLQYKNLSESTFTEGVLSAFKDSVNKDFKLIQTDAKISTGSSGGPMLDAQGNVIGVTTYESLQSSAGDIFAFAVPIQLPKDFLVKSNLIYDTPQDYYNSFLAGFNLALNNHCKSALKQFHTASTGIDENFAVDDYLAPYITSCESKIVSGASIDTQLDSLMAKVKNNGNGSMIAVIAIGVLVLAGVVIFLLFKRLKKDEHDIGEMQAHQPTGPIAGVPIIPRPTDSPLAPPTPPIVPTDLPKIE